MAGWIKVEKDLETDPRVLRMARELAKRWTVFSSTAANAGGHFEPCNAVAYHGVTQVIGALTRIWIFADSHARDDDSLDMGAAEIDAWLNIPGFCALMPPDWLEEIDEFTVKLPGFHAHNGVEAKRRALTKKRVTKYRNKQKPHSVTECNDEALPDLDQTKTRPRPKRLKNGERHRPGVEKVDRVVQPTDPDDPLVPDVPGLNRLAFTQWVNYHTAIGKPYRPKFLPTLADKLVSFGSPESQQAAVTDSIANGYQGLFAPKAGTNDRSRLLPPKTRFDAAQDRIREWAADRGELLVHDDPTVRPPLDGHLRGGAPSVVADSNLVPGRFADPDPRRATHALGLSAPANIARGHGARDQAADDEQQFEPAAAGVAR